MRLIEIQKQKIVFCPRNPEWGICKFIERNNGGEVVIQSCRTDKIIRHYAKLACLKPVNILTYYEVAHFDTLWQADKNAWIAGFFCQDETTSPNDGLICYLPLQGKPKCIRDAHLSPVCSNPALAIKKAYGLWFKNKDKEI